MCYQVELKAAGGIVSPGGAGDPRDLSRGHRQSWEEESLRRRDLQAPVDRAQAIGVEQCLQSQRKPSGRKIVYLHDRKNRDSRIRGDKELELEWKTVQAGSPSLQSAR